MLLLTVEMKPLPVSLQREGPLYLRRKPADLLATLVAVVTVVVVVVVVEITFIQGLRIKSRTS